jgi:site-specific DNA recombinase
VEHEKIKERTMRGKLARVQSGKLLPNGKPLYGYRWRDASKGALDIDETTAPTVQRIFRDIASGKTLRRLATELTQEGVPTPTGRGTMWYGSALQVILHNPAYKGQAYAWGLRRSTQGQPQMFDPARAIALPEGTIPAIVEPAVWESVQEILTRNQQRAVRNAKNPEAALLRGGFGTCGYCGATLSARPRSNGAYDYLCGSHRYSVVRRCPCPTIVTHALDRVVWDYVTEVITQPDVVARELARLREQDPSADDFAAIDRAMASVKRQQGNVARAIALMDDDEGTGPLVAQLEELNRRVRKLDEERTAIEQRQASWEQAQEQLEGLEAWRQHVAKNLDTLTYDGRRRALDALGIHITLYAADHDPRYVITASIPLESDVVYSTT